MDTELYVRDRIVEAYRLATGRAPESADPYWLSGAAYRIAERLMLRHPQGADDAVRLRFESEAVGRSLRDYHYFAPEYARETWEVIHRDSSVLNSAPQIRDLDPNHLPHPLNYLMHSLGGVGKQMASALESHWLVQSPLIQEDYELRRNYGLFTCRFAVYERCDRNLRNLRVSDPVFSAPDSYARFQSRIGWAKVGYLSLAALASAGATWLLARQSDLAGSILVGLTLFAAVLILFNRAFGKYDNWMMVAMSEVAPMVALEDAIRGCTCPDDLDRCLELSQSLFVSGYIEAKYVANVIRRPLHSLK